MDPILFAYRGGIFGYLLTRHDRAVVNGKSFAPYPGLIRLSKAKLRRLSSDLFPHLAKPSSVVRWLFGDSLSIVYEIGDILLHGGSGAAVVMQTDPLLVASYSQNLDCIAMLRFPSFLVDEYSLAKGSRLLTILNGRLGPSLARDLEHGAASRHDLANFIPFIGDFLSDDVYDVEKRKAGVSYFWWDRTTELGEQHPARHGTKARDGCPPNSWIPAFN